MEPVEVSFRVCMYVCMYVCMFAYVHACKTLSLNKPPQNWLRCAYVCICVCVCAWCACVYVITGVRCPMYMYIYPHTNKTYSCICACSQEIHTQRVFAYTLIHKCLISQASKAWVNRAHSRMCAELQRIYLPGTTAYTHTFLWHTHTHTHKHKHTHTHTHTHGWSQALHAWANRASSFRTSHHRDTRRRIAAIAQTKKTWKRGGTRTCWCW